LAFRIFLLFICTVLTHLFLGFPTVLFPITLLSRKLLKFDDVLFSVKKVA
jgi:hypothetical protein